MGQYDAVLYALVFVGNHSRDSVRVPIDDEADSRDSQTTFMFAFFRATNSPGSAVNRMSTEPITQIVSQKGEHD